jgi:hypothetical protein
MQPSIAVLFKAPDSATINGVLIEVVHLLIIAPSDKAVML